MADSTESGSLASAARVAVLAVAVVAGIPLAMNEWREMSAARARDGAQASHMAEAARHVGGGRYDLATVGYRKAANARSADAGAARATDHLLILNAVRNPQTLQGKVLTEVEYIVERALAAPTPPPHRQYYLAARGAVRAVQGLIEPSLKDFDDAIAADGAFSPAWYFKGKVLADTGRPDDAQPTLEKAIELDPRSGVSHKRLARLHVDADRLDQAATVLKRVLDDEVFGADAEAHYLMGVVKDRQADFEGARQHFMRTLQLDPAFPNLDRSLGLTMFKLKRWKDAVQILGKVYERTRDIAIYYYIGRSFMELGDLRKAATILQAVVVNYPAHAEAAFDLATLLDNSTQGATAAAYYSAFLQVVERTGRKDLEQQVRTARLRLDALRQLAGSAPR